MRRAVFELTPSRRRKHWGAMVHSERESVDMVFVDDLPSFHIEAFTVTASRIDPIADPMNQQLAGIRQALKDGRRQCVRRCACAPRNPRAWQRVDHSTGDISACINSVTLRVNASVSVCGEDVRVKHGVVLYELGFVLTGLILSQWGLLCQWGL